MTQLAVRPDAPTTALSTGRAAAAVTVMFAVNGLILGGWGGSLPSLRERLDLSSGQIAALLFTGGLAAIASMQVGGRLSDRLGARRVVLSALPVLIAAVVVVAFAPTFAAALVASVLLGLGNGALDVAQNALGVQVERARRRPIMSFFHAFFSVGNLAGAGAVLGLATVLGLGGGDIVMPLMLTLAVVSVAVLVVLVRISPEAATVEHRVDGVRTTIPRVAWLLGIMALAFGLAEGTAVDWSALHVTDVAQVDSTTGSLGLVAVSGLMVVIRLVGDLLVARFGRRNVVRFGGICAAVGYAAVTVVTGLPLLLLGWALVGFGVGMIAPQVYAVAGHIGGGRVLAVVVTFGYAAFLMGPAVIGFAVQAVGVQQAMALPALLGVAIVGLALTMPKTDDDLAR